MGFTNIQKLVKLGLSEWQKSQAFREIVPSFRHLPEKTSFNSKKLDQISAENMKENWLIKT